MILVEVKIVPNASKNAFLERKGSVWKIALKAVPEKGKANKLLIKWLSKELKIPQAEITIVSGKNRPNKILGFSIEYAKQIEQKEL